jgi:MFS family permease
MGILVEKHRGGYFFTGIAKLSIVGMLVSLSAAFTNTIWAVYIDSFLHSEVYTGFFSTFLTLVAFVSYFIFIPFVEKFDKAKIFSYSLLSFVVFYLIFTFSSNLVLLFVISVIMTAVLSLRVTSYGLLVKDISERKNLAKNEGLVYTFLNISFVVGPLIAGFIAARFGNPWVFAISALFILTSFVFFKSTGIKDEEGKKRTDKNMIKNFFEFFKKSDRTIAYLLRGGVNMWWILIYLFIPLWMIRHGLSTSDIGIFLFAVAIPLIALEFFFSRKAARIGFRKIFQFGYLFVAVIALLCFFLSDIYLILAFLVLASIGLAMLEPTTEAYFFDILGGKERYRFYGPFNTSIDFGNFVAKILGSTLLIFLPFNALFAMYAALMFLLFLVAFKTKKVIESRRR